jgi:TolB-like protein/class 3 adenylate cyclase/Tfp pilus assembly protein PilF
MTEEQAKRKLTAILSADVKGYSRLMADDEEATVRTINAYREVMTGLIKDHRGRVVDAKGDNVLAEFSSVVDAVRCAVQVQKELTDRNSELPEHRRMEFRIGINLGDVIEEQGTIYGDGVNVAARLEGLAEGGGICISGTAFDHVKNRIPVGYGYQGKKSVKNIPDPVRVYKVLLEPEAAGKIIGEEESRPRRKRWAAIALVAVLAVVAGGLMWNFYLRPPPIEPASVDRMAYPLPDKPSIAVLPFVNMSEDKGQDFFCDGITEEIITALSKTPKMLVIARNSTFTYKGKPVKVNQVAEELGVRYVLEGSVRKAGDLVRITAQLIDALSGHHLWAERYDRDLKDIFAIQDEITIKILTLLRVRLTEGEMSRTQASDTNNLDAYLLFLQGQEEARRMNKDGNFLSRQLARQAIALDSKYAMAYNLLANSYVNEIVLGLSNDPRLSLGKAMELTQKAIVLDNSLALPYALLGFIYTLMRQHDKGIAECEQAVNLEPNSALAHYRYSLALNYAGRPKEAITMFKEAIRLDPIPVSLYYQSLTNAYCLTGEYEEAIAAGKKATSLGPNNLVAHAFLAAAYSLHGREEEARAEASEVLRINPNFLVQSWEKTMPFRNQADLELVIGALRKAGLK